MATRRIAVRNFRDGSIVRLAHDSWCVPLPIDREVRSQPLEILSVERTFEDLACVAYEYGDGIGSYVTMTREVLLDECLPGTVVVVRSQEERAGSCWMVVQVGAAAIHAA